MVGTCVVYGCTNRQEKGGNISFFHFPQKNPPVLKQWANAVTGWERLIRSHSSARFCFELSGSSN